MLLPVLAQEPGRQCGRITNQVPPMASRAFQQRLRGSQTPAAALSHRHSRGLGSLPMHADGCVGTPFRPSRVSDFAQQLPAEWSAILPGPSAPRARHGSQCDGPDGIVDGVHESGTNQCESSGLRASTEYEDVTCQLRRRQTDWPFSSGKVREPKDEVVRNKPRQSPEFVNSLKAELSFPRKGGHN